MAILSKETKERLAHALTKRSAMQELVTVLAAGPYAQAAAVAALGATTNLSASNASLSTGDTYADADVKAAIDGAVDALAADAESRLDAAEAKIDAILAALKTAELMDS